MWKDAKDMPAPTVELLGLTDLAKIPEFLRLGAVVVVAPDLEALRRWWREREADFGIGPERTHPPGLDIDVDGRRVLWDGDPIALTDLEFRVFSLLASTPGRAWSFEEIHETGWEGTSIGRIDAYAVRSVVQRIRRKLSVVSERVLIESVRGYGFRFVDDPRPAAAPALWSIAPS